MRKFALLSLLALLAASVHAQSVNLNLSVGYLENANGSAKMSDGMLLQVIASPDATFSTVTSSAFVSGNDFVLWSGPLDAAGTTGADGTMLFSASGSAANDYIMLRWFPTLASSALTPGSGTAYGQFGYGAGDNTWIAPASGSGDLNFFTNSANTDLGLGASNPVNDSYSLANLSTPAVPEPSTYAAIFGLFAVGVVCLRRKVTAL